VDPFTLLQTGIGVAGLAMSIFGGSSMSSTAKESAQVSQQMFATEEDENNVRRQAMEMSARRSQIETLRTAQRARAMAVQAGSTQTGSLTGSGVKGGIAETQNEGLYGLQGINNQLSFGRHLFDLDDHMNMLKAQQASLQSSMATSQGIASMGGSIMKAGPMIGNFANQAFGDKSLGVMGSVGIGGYNGVGGYNMPTVGYSPSPAPVNGFLANQPTDI